MKKTANFYEEKLGFRIVEYLKYTYAVLAKGQIPNYEITQSYLIKQDKKFYIQLLLPKGTNTFIPLLSLDAKAKGIIYVKV